MFLFALAINNINYDVTTKTLNINADHDYTRDTIDREVKGNEVKVINIEGSYNEIPDGAFAEMAVETVNIKTTIKTINSMAFYGCNNLKAFTVPQGCEYIGFDCFRHCKSLKSFYYRACTMTFEANAFQGCPSLETFVLLKSDNSKPVNGVDRTYGPSLFKDCAKLSTCQLAEDTVEIGAYMFAGTQVSVTLPASLTKIPRYCFHHSSITEIDLSHIVHIGVHAFCDCEQLVKVTFGSPLREIQAYAFHNCPRAELVGLEKANYTFECYTFAKILTLKTFTFPVSMYSVPAGAFFGCTNLNKIVYNGHIFQIWEVAFFNTNLQDISISEVLQWAAPGSFAGIQSNKAFTVDPKNDYYTTDMSGRLLVKKDKQMTYCYATGEEGVVTIPSQYTIIGPYTFAGCKAIQINLGDTASTLCGHAFMGCPNLAAIVGNDGMAVIQDSVFAGCTALTQVYLPQVAYINNKAFAGCTALQKIKMPNIISIGDLAFMGCKNLNIEFNFKHLQYIGSKAFFGCGFTTLDLPQSLLYVQDHAFKNCMNLREVHVRGNTTFQEHAFCTDAQFTDIIFHTDVAVMNSEMFAMASALKTITYCGTKAPAGKLDVKNVYVYTTTQFLPSTFMGLKIESKLDQCPEVPPTPPTPPTSAPTSKPTSEPPTSAPTRIPTTEKPEPTGGDDAQKMKKIVMVESIVGAVVIVCLVSVVCFLIFCRGAKNSMDSTPLITQN